MEKNEKYTEKLSEIDQHSPFRVPDDYFDNFYARLDSKLHGKEENRSVVKEYRLYHFLKPALAIAASISAIILMLYWPIGAIRQKNMANSDQTVVYSIEDVYFTMVSNLDENSFYALLSEPEKKEKLTMDEIASIVNSTFSDFEIYAETK